MASPSSLFSQISEGQLPSANVQKLEGSPDFAVKYIDDLEDSCSSDEETDESEYAYTTDTNIMEQLFPEKRLKKIRAAPEQKPLIPDRPHNPSVVQLAQKLRACDADPDAVEYLTDEVWPRGTITLEGLMTPMGAVELRVFKLAAGSSKYLGLFKQQDRTALCRLCPLDNSLDFDDPESGLYHITSDHFDMGYSCQCGW